MKDKKDKLTSDNEKRKLKKKNDGLVDHMKVNLIIYDSLRKSRALGQKLVEKCRIPSLVIKRIILLLVFIVLFLSTV